MQGYPTSCNRFLCHLICLKHIKIAIKTTIKDEVRGKWNNKVKLLVMQGDFVNLLIEEQESITWQCIIRKMPRNVMSFAARLSTNSLATPDNLKRWG